MTCMKCGRELETEQSFCEDCLLEMKRYPVSPSAVVNLPLRRQDPAPRKVPKRRSISPEEQVKLLKKRIWVLIGVLAVTAALLLAAVYPTFLFFQRSYYLRPGQNYTAITSTPETAADLDGLAE